MTIVVALNSVHSKLKKVSSTS